MVEIDANQQNTLDPRHPGSYTTDEDPLAPDTNPLLLQKHTVDHIDSIDDQYLTDFDGNIWRRKTWTVPHNIHPLSQILQRISVPKWRPLSFVTRRIKPVSSVDSTSLGSADWLHYALFSRHRHLGTGPRPYMTTRFAMALRLQRTRCVWKSIQTYGAMTQVQIISRNLRAEFNEHFSLLAPSSSFSTSLHFMSISSSIAILRIPIRIRTHWYLHVPLLAKIMKMGNSFCARTGSLSPFIVLSCFRCDGIAFYTDVLHAVTEVTSGVRVTLQFDIYLEDDTVERPHTSAWVPGSNDLLTDVKSEYEAAVSTPLSDDKDPHVVWSRFDEFGFGYAAPSVAVLDVLDEFVSRIKNVLSGTTDTPVGPEVQPETPRTVMFALAHLYRRRSIQPSYVKGADAALHQALSACPELAVSMHPVVFRRETTGCMRERQIMRPSLALSRQTIGICAPIPPERIPMYLKPTLFLHRATEARAFYTGDAHLGNDSGPPYTLYVAGAMFVTLAPGPPLDELVENRGPTDYVDSDGEELRLPDSEGGGDDYDDYDDYPANYVDLEYDNYRSPIPDNFDF